MSMTNGEKDSLLGQTVLPPELGQILGGLGFFYTPFITEWIVTDHITEWIGSDRRMVHDSCPPT